MNLLLLAQIAQAFGVLATNPLLGDKADEVGKVAGLVGLAFSTAALNDADRKVLLEQILAANARGGGLTEEEKSVWSLRHEDARAVIQGWTPASGG